MIQSTQAMDIMTKVGDLQNRELLGELVRRSHVGNRTSFNMVADEHVVYLCNCQTIVICPLFCSMKLSVLARQSGKNKKAASSREIIRYNIEHVTVYHENTYF